MNLLTKLRYVPKHFGVFAAVAVATIGTALTFAWGPGRDTYTMAQPADHITFNSITDNSEVGDERNFLVVKDAANTAAGGWQDSVTVEPGKEYLVRLYVHNDAAANLNLVATNTRAMVALGTNTGTKVSMTGYVSADNATPTQVWDDASFTSSNNFNMTYIAGSAHIYNNATGINGRAVADAIMNGTGTPIGYDANNGKLPGCMQYASYILFKVKPQFQQTANFTLVKDVRKSGTPTYGQTAAVNPGDKVDYRITFQNIGTAQLDNVVIKDMLPTGITYVAGTAKLTNSNHQYPNMLSLPDSLFTSTGVNIGNYPSTSNAFVTFTGQVAANDNLATCGANTLTNVAKAESDYGYTTDTAVVTTNKTCEQPKPVYSCDGLAVDKISRTDFKFTVSKTVQNATYVKTIFVIRNEAGAVVATVDSVSGVLSYTQNTVGKYTVQASVVVNVGGVEKTVTSDDCKKPFEVVSVPTGKVEVCDATSGKIITVDETDASKYEPIDSPSCKMTVCNKTTGELNITINKDQFDSSMYSTNNADCQKTPPVLPSTGPEALLGGLTGASALSYGAYTYATSRRALKNARK